MRAHLRREPIIQIATQHARLLSHPSMQVSQAIALKWMATAMALPASHIAGATDLLFSFDAGRLWRS